MDDRRLKIEFKAMKQLWPQFEARKAGKDLFWTGTISSIIGVFKVVIKYSKDYPLSPPHVFVLNPNDLGLEKDKEGRIVFKQDWQPNYTAATVIKWLQKRLQMELPPTNLENRIVYVPVCCGATKQKYTLVFKEGIEKKTSLIGIETSLGFESSEKNPSEVISNINWSQYAKLEGCPYCHNINLVLCGRCQHLSCQGGTTKKIKGIWFTCPWCNEKGFILGTFNRLDGYSSPKKKKF